MCINWWLWAIVIEGCFLCPLTVTISGELQIPYSLQPEVSCASYTIGIWMIKITVEVADCIVRAFTFDLWTINGSNSCVWLHSLVLLCTLTVALMLSCVYTSLVRYFQAHRCASEDRQMHSITVPYLLGIESDDGGQVGMVNRTMCRDEWRWMAGTLMLILLYILTLVQIVSYSWPGRWTSEAEMPCRCFSIWITC